MNYGDVFISCLYSHSDGTHSLQRIHWCSNNVKLNFSKSVPVKKQTHLHLGWPEDEYIFSNLKKKNCELSFKIASNYINISCEKPSISSSSGSSSPLLSLVTSTSEISHQPNKCKCPPSMSTGQHEACLFVSFSSLSKLRQTGTSKHISREMMVTSRTDLLQ